jgi:YVTN family beta-propeller protein
MNMRGRVSCAAAVLAIVVGMASPAAAESRQKLYVLHGEGHALSIIDVATQEIIGSVDVGELPHGVAAPSSQKLLYVAVEGEDSMVAIDTQLDKVTEEFDSFGRWPNEIDVTSDGRFVYLPILGDGIYQVFDTEKEEIVAEIPTDGYPHNVVISPNDKFAYLSPMDRGTESVEAVKALDLPTSLNQKIYVVDVATHKTVATIDTGDAPRPIAINPNGKYLYVNTDGLQGFLTLDLEKREVASRVEYSLTEREKARPSRTHGLWVTPDGKEVWTCDVNHGIIFGFDATQNPPVQVARVETNAPAYWLEGTPDGKTVYVTSAPGDVVSVIDIASRKMTGVIQLPKGSAPKRMLVLDVPAE